MPETNQDNNYYLQGYYHGVAGKPPLVGNHPYLNGYNDGFGDWERGVTDEDVSNAKAAWNQEFYESAQIVDD